ncbi:hypothetical protein ACFUC1_15725 [Pedococcus sp. NPDC057267]|uniref:hypothetical protein n=1 Tax=Pedococcus sp. NPDC057267 TaxID=3346077 RepID=UPI003639135D
MTALVLSSRAEEATRLLFQTLGMHQQAILNHKTPRTGRRLAVAGSDPLQVQRQATLLRLVSITESFCADRLIDHTEQAINPAADPVRTKVWEQAAIDATKTWEAQREAFKKWHSITPDWLPLEGLSEARNAVAHGLGSLTRRQRRGRSATMTKINRTGISVVNDRLLLEERDLTAAAKACREIIRQIDAATRPTSPQ